MKLQELKQNNEAPHWLDEEGFLTLSRGYLLPNETPRGMYLRLAKSASKYFHHENLEEKFFDIMWKN